MKLIKKTQIEPRAHVFALRVARDRTIRYLLTGMMVISFIMIAGLSQQALADPSDCCPASGELTKKWLELQRSGEQAAVHPDGISSDVVENIYQRYVNSFTHEIPETYSREGEGLEFGSGGN